MTTSPGETSNDRWFEYLARDSRLHNPDFLKALIEIILQSVVVQDEDDGKREVQDTIFKKDARWLQETYGRLQLRTGDIHSMKYALGFRGTLTNKEVESLIFKDESGVFELNKMGFNILGTVFMVLFADAGRQNVLRKALTAVCG